MGVYRNANSQHWWFYLESAPPGQRKRRSAFLVGHTKTAQKASRAAAEEAYHAEMLHLGKLAHGLDVDKPAMPFTTFATWYEQHVVAHHRGAARERQILQTLRTAFTGDHVTDLTRDRVLEWRTARTATVSAATSNRELDLLKHLLAVAVPTYLDRSPIAQLKRLRGRRSETRVLTREEEPRLLAALRPADRALVLCALDTLMRLSDVVNLRREQDHGPYLVVVDPKVAPYQVPVSARLRAALDVVPKAGPYYFPQRRRAKNPRDYRGSVKAMLKAACTAADIPYGRPRQRPGQPPPPIGLTFHGLRHTAASRLVDAGVSLRIIQELGGWKSLRQLERYAHPTESSKRQAVEQIGAERPATPRLVKTAARRATAIPPRRAKHQKSFSKSG